jgi:hypothetical protein
VGDQTKNSGLLNIEESFGGCRQNYNLLAGLLQGTPHKHVLISVVLRARQH